MEPDAKDRQIAQLEADLAQQIEVNLKLHERVAMLEARVADLAGRVSA